MTALPRRVLGRKPRSPTLISGLLTAALVSVSGAGARAQAQETGAQLAAPATRVPGATGQLSKYNIDDNEPLKDLPPLQELRKDPLEFGYLLMDLGVIADKAFDGKDYERAVRYYKAIATVVPEKSVGFTQLCASYAELGKFEHALETCRAALSLEGTKVRDYERFLALLLRPDGKPSPQVVKEADEVFAHIAAQKVDEPAFHRLACDLAVKLEDVKRLEACTAALSMVAPKDAKTLTYQWTLALMKKDDKRALLLIEQAKAAGMKPEGVRRMQAATLALGKRLNRSRTVAGVALLAVAALGLFLLGRHYLRQFRARSAELSPS